jgi:hypothetical protein
MSNFSSSSIHRMKLRRHPVVCVAQILAPWFNSKAEVQMSKYNYVPQSFQDHRSEFSLQVNLLNENKLLAMLTSLEPEYELAMHSKIIIDNNVYHIPMIDFGSKGTSPAASETIKELCRHWNIGFNIFESGRSFHAYGNRLLTNEQWIQFMGSLLLLNKPSGYKLIDERWIGHRIMAGYSALRWSKNTSQYKKFPTYCGFVSGEYFSVNETEVAAFLPSSLINRS